MADGVVVDMTNVEEAEVVDVAIRCFTVVPTLTTTMIDLIAVEAPHISRRRIRRISHAHISPSRDMVAIIRALDPHRTMVEQHTTILLLAEVRQLVEADHLRVHNSALVEAVPLDQVTEGLEEIMAATAATVQADEVGMGVTEVTGHTGDRQPMVMVATAAAARTTTQGVEAGVDIEKYIC
jgi:hypothetical protein